MGYTVALDDGHGMETPGKRTPKFEDGTFMKENEFNAAVVKIIERHLKRHNIKVVLTAPTDKDTPLKTRCETANKANADVFVSVHANAYKGAWGNAKGIETYHYPGSSKGKKLATCIQRELMNGTKMVDRGVKTAKFYVLKNTKMPAALCECGFMDNKREARLLMSKEYREECGEEIARGILKYFGLSFKAEKTGNKEKSSNMTAPKGKLYKVQCGAFSKKANADKLGERLKKKGYNYFIFKSNGYYKVQCGAFSKKANAQKHANNLKKDGFDTYIVLE